MSNAAAPVETRNPSGYDAEQLLFHEGAGKGNTAIRWNPALERGEFWHVFNHEWTPCREWHPGATDTDPRAWVDYQLSFATGTWKHWLRQLEWDDTWAEPVAHA